MRHFFIVILFSIIFVSCDNVDTNSGEFSNDLSDKTVTSVAGKLSLIQDSFLFFAISPYQAYFVYPQSNLALFKNHFYIQANVGDIVTCGVIGRKSGKNQLIIKAELLKTYKGDVSGIASICSGQDARLYFTLGSKEININSKPVIEYKDFKTPRLIFPIIPHFGFSLKDVAAPGTDEIKITVQIEFFDRISKTILSSCTYYTINDEKDDQCYAVPMAYPESSFYGKTYKSLQLHPIKSNLEYLENITYASN